MILTMLREAWQALSANRLRSFLTMLGMVIGVAAVILMLAIGQGVQQSVQAQIASMGSNLLVILSGSGSTGGVRTGGGGAPTLTLADAESIGELPWIAAVAPTANGNAQIVYGSVNWNTQIIGTTPSYLDVRDWNIADGDSFTDSDVRSATRVALLGKTVVDKLFSEESPIGKTIRIKNSPYVIIGVLGAKGQSLDGRDQDDTILVPVTTAQRKLFGTQFQGMVRFIMAQVTSAEEMVQAEQGVNELLRQRHRIGPNNEDDFSVRNLTAIANTAAETTKIMAFMLGAIASISLLVGGIGIMNIMLVSVTERTREIGIRIAIGARQRDILRQFLLEAIILSVFGCLVGVLLGIAGSILVRTVFEFSTVVTMGSIAMSFMVAAGVGVFFGFYPARKAAKLKPIDALRYQ